MVQNGNFFCPSKMTFAHPKIWANGLLDKSLIRDNKIQILRWLERQNEVVFQFKGSELATIISTFLICPWHKIYGE